MSQKKSGPHGTRPSRPPLGAAHSRRPNRLVLYDVLTTGPSTDPDSDTEKMAPVGDHDKPTLVGNPELIADLASRPEARRTQPPPASTPRIIYRRHLTPRPSSQGQSHDRRLLGHPIIVGEPPPGEGDRLLPSADVEGAVEKGLEWATANPPPNPEAPIPGEPIEELGLTLRNLTPHAHTDPSHTVAMSALPYGPPSKQKASRGLTKREVVLAVIAGILFLLEIVHLIKK